jgi:hypothetical protein
MRLAVPRRVFLGVFLCLLCAVCARPALASAFDPTVPEPTTAPDLREWHNLYDWTTEPAHGHFGWDSFTSAPNRGDYGFARGRDAAGKGLWVWPTGEDRAYTPPTVAEWRYQAPGTTRTRKVDVELDYAPRLLSNHCVNLLLRDADGATLASTGFCNTPADHSEGQRPITHLSITDPGPGAPTAKQVAIGFSVKCDKPNPPDCTKVISNANADQDGVHIRKVDMTLVDDDNPVPTPSGQWFDLRDKYVNGEGQHPLTMAADDPGAGLTRVAVEEVGVGELDRASATCDPTHHTEALANRLCPGSFAAPTVIDARPLREGKHTYRETGKDLTGHIGASDPWVVYVDRTGPLAPTVVDANFDPEAGTTIVGWGPPVDPLLADGSPGSGVGSYRYRYQRGASGWSAWQTTATPWAVFSASFATEQITVQVQGIDAVGNEGAIGSATVSGAQDSAEVCDAGDDCADGPDQDAPDNAPDGGDGALCTTRAECSSPPAATSGNSLRAAAAPRECRGAFFGRTPASRTALVVFRREPSGRLRWDFYLTAVTRAAIGPTAIVNMPLALVNGDPINPPYRAHVRRSTYDFHGSMRVYQRFGDGGGRNIPLQTGDTVSLFWTMEDTRPADEDRVFGFRFIACAVPPPGTR